MAVPSWRWRKRRPSRKTRDAVLWALRGGAALCPHDLAGETGMDWRRVCTALDDLSVRGLVELDGTKYRRTDRE
jgi:hypothetical protein